MPRKPRCQFCEEEIEKEIDEWIHRSDGYYHTECYEQKINEKEHCCYYCKDKVKVKDSIKVDNHYYHLGCYNEYRDRTQLYKYVCLLFGLKKPGPVIISQAKNFRSRGYTFRGMTKTLQYFYEVKNNPRDKFKGEETIGIIPYVYNDASDYFYNLAEKQTELAIQAEKNFNSRVEKVVIDASALKCSGRPRTKRKNKMLNFE